MKFETLLKSSFTGLTLVLVTAAIQTASAAEISGKVKLNGTPKPEADLKDVVAGSTCGPVVHKQLTTRHFVVGADKGLANVFVYIKQGASPTPPAADSKPVLDQVDCQYEPYVMGLVVNQKLAIKNSDTIMHNVHATPKVNKEFNFAQVTKGQVNEKAFDKTEVLVRMKCDVHPWMFAYIGVLDHPYFSVTDKDGSFKISNLPAGKYTIEAYHLKAGSKSQEITVTADDKKTVDFELQAPPP
jgi:carboxypeptidase family protein